MGRWENIHMLERFVPDIVMEHIIQSTHEVASKREAEDDPRVPPCPVPRRLALAKTTKMSLLSDSTSRTPSSYSLTFPGLRSSQSNWRRTTRAGKGRVQKPFHKS